MSTRHHACKGTTSGRKTLLHQQPQQHNHTVKATQAHKRVHSSGCLGGPLSPRSTLNSRSYLRSQSGGVEVEVLPSTRFEEDEVMPSFLQFCPSCEKQILSTSISVLYCSEACRRRDSAKSPPSYHSPPSSPHSTGLNDYPTTTIVPRRSPTILRPLSTTFSELSLYELGSRRSPSPASHVDDSTFGMPTQAVRPYIRRNHSSSDDAGQLPSLVNSPSSSYGTVASHVEPARPLPRKHSCPSSKGVDLVTPMSANRLEPLTSTKHDSALSDRSQKTRAGGGSR